MPQMLQPPRLKKPKPPQRSKRLTRSQLRQLKRRLLRPRQRQRRQLPPKLLLLHLKLQHLLPLPPLLLPQILWLKA